MKALLIIDIQNDYFPGGAAELVNPDAALANAKILLAEFRDKKLPVIHVQHINMREGSTFFLPDTEGTKIHRSLTPKDGEYLVVKHFPNSFYQTDLLEIVESSGITELVVCGMMTQMCIDTTVRAAKDYALPVTLISDACATKAMMFEGVVIPAAQVQAAFMAALFGMFAKIVTTEKYMG